MHLGVDNRWKAFPDVVECLDPGTNTTAETVRAYALSGVDE
jgi:hypothetical protein